MTEQTIETVQSRPVDCGGSKRDRKQDKQAQQTSSHLLMLVGVVFPILIRSLTSFVVIGIIWVTTTAVKRAYLHDCCAIVGQDRAESDTRHDQSRKRPNLDGQGWTRRLYGVVIDGPLTEQPALNKRE